MKTNLYIEMAGQQTESKQLMEAAKEIWKADGNKLKDLESLDIYYKPEEQTCYYVINSCVKGSFEL